MSNEDKKSKKKQPKLEPMSPSDTIQSDEVKPEEHPRGYRGEVGQLTASLSLWQKWHAEHFTRHDIGDKHNPRKRVWVRNHGAPSLKKFARALLKSGDPVAKEWFAHKRGSLNAKRNDKNAARVLLERAASKAARRKNKSG